MIVIERPAEALVRFILFDKDIDSKALMVADIVEISTATARKTQNIVMGNLADKAIHLWDVNDRMQTGAEAILRRPHEEGIPAKRERQALIAQLRSFFEGPAQ